MRIRTAISLLLAGLSLLVTVLVSASPAAAASQPMQCSARSWAHLCLYYDSNFSGPVYGGWFSMNPSGAPNYTNIYVSGISLNDKVSSIKVAPGCYVVLYTDVNYRGQSARVQGWVSNLGAWNDKFSSHRLYCS